MTFKTTVKDAMTRQPIILAIARGTDLTLGNSFPRGTDGGGYADVDMKGTPSDTMCMLEVTSPGYQNFIGYYTITREDVIVNVELNPTFNRPSKDTVRTFQGSFGGLRLDYLRYSINDTKILFTPGYVVESDEVRYRIRQDYKAAGLTHFPLNLYNTAPIYSTFYPDWDDNLIDKYLMELLNDGLIPVGSAFSDNVKTVKPVVSPKLVPAVFTGWENPWPILRPQLDSDNLFWTARQYFGPDTLVYWHNPPGQGAPYYHPTEWGYPPDADINAVVWNYIVHQSGCQGLLFQGKGWNEPNAHPPYNGVETSKERLDDFVIRFKHGINGWPVADLVDFEETVYYCTTMAGNLEQGLAWANEIRTSVPELNGFCNG